MPNNNQNLTQQSQYEKRRCANGCDLNKHQSVSSDLEIQAIIGLYPHERVNAQRLLLSAKIYFDSIGFEEYVVKKIFKSESLRYFETSKPLLLERALFDLSQRLASTLSQIIHLDLTIEKPQALSNARCSFATTRFCPKS